MQKKLLTAAVAGALAMPVAALAQVTLFGTIDTGLRSASKVITPTGDDSLITMTDGARTTNRWGFRGSEDLGGGLMANFWFEGQYNSDTGGGPVGAGLFQRQNWVGLSKGGMDMRLGRDYTVNFKTQGIYDPMSYTYTGITPAAGTNTANVRSSNMVQAGFRFGTGGIRVDYALGEVAGDNSSGTRFGINGDFAIGPVTLAAAFSNRAVDLGVGVGEAEVDTTNFGARWIMGAFTFRAGYSTSEATSPVGDLDTPMILAGVQYAISPTLNARLGYYDTTFDVNGVEVGDRSLFILALDYYLSKRTTVYVAIDRHEITNFTASANADTGVITVSGVAGTGLVLGANSNDGATGFSVGLAHSF